MASKVKGHLTEMLSRFSNLAGHVRDREAMPNEANSTNIELHVEEKVTNRTLAEDKEKRMKKRNKTAAEKICVVNVEKALQDSFNAWRLAVAEPEQAKEQLNVETVAQAV